MKRICKYLITISICFISLNSYATQLDSSRIYYDKDNYYKSSGQWLDINSDGVYECYYFNVFGHMLKNGKTPDGYYVNEEGQWVIDGVVQYKTIFEVQSYVNDSNSSNDSKVDEIKQEFTDALNDLIEDRIAEAKSYITTKVIDKKLLFDLQGYYTKLMNDTYNVFYKDIVELYDDNLISKDNLKEAKTLISSILKEKEKILKSKISSLSNSITWQLKPEEYKDNKKRIIK